MEDQLYMIHEEERGMLNDDRAFATCGDGDVTLSHDGR